MADVRTFVGVDLAPQVLRALEGIQAQLRAAPGGRACRWVSAASIHLTFHFLGDVPEERLSAIGDAVARGCRAFDAMPITIAGLGCFPSIRQPRIVWAGVRDESGRLAALQPAIGRELAGIGYPPERRPFHPHLTIARARRDAPRDALAALGRSVAAYPPEPLATMRIDRVHVFRSDLRPAGAVYTILATTSLGTPSREA